MTTVQFLRVSLPNAVPGTGSKTQKGLPFHGRIVGGDTERRRPGINSITASTRSVDRQHCLVLFDPDRRIVGDYAREHDQASGAETKFLGPDHPGWAVDAD